MASVIDGSFLSRSTVLHEWILSTVLREWIFSFKIHCSAVAPLLPLAEQRRRHATGERITTLLLLVVWIYAFFFRTDLLSFYPRRRNFKKGTKEGFLVEGLSSFFFWEVYC